MSLSDEIDSKRATIHTDGYPMSIGELLNLYKDGELDIHPEFQRFFRWTDQQKSRLIESLLLGIPLPSIFVSQRHDGIWDVIDGLQRLSTIFQLVGLLRDENNELVQPLMLSRTKYLPSLEGKTWGEEETNDSTLDRTQQLIIKRSKIDVKIILRESDEASKYELFQRLNTGGSPLSDQELRNCILITVNRSFYHWIVELARSDDFQKCIALTDRSLEEQYDLELVVRFLVFRSISEVQLKGIGDIGEYLTDALVELAQSTTFNRDAAAEAFYATFSYLARALGDDSFKRFDAVKGRFMGGFLLSAYEVIALGIGANFGLYGPDSPTEKVKSEAQSFWSEPEFLSKVGSGVRASSRIPYTIPLGRVRFHHYEAANA